MLLFCTNTHTHPRNACDKIDSRVIHFSSISFGIFGDSKSIFQSSYCKLPFSFCFVFFLERPFSNLDFKLFSRPKSLYAGRFPFNLFYTNTNLYEYYIVCVYVFFVHHSFCLLLSLFKYLHTQFTV